MSEYALADIFEGFELELDEETAARITRDRRIAPRHGFALYCTVEQMNGVRRRGRTRDLSERGFGVRLEQPIATRETVNVEITLAWEDVTFFEPLKLPATIVRCQHAGPWFDLGGRFNRASMRLQTFIHMYGEYVDESHRLGGGEPLARSLSGVHRTRF